MIGLAVGLWIALATPARRVALRTTVPAALGWVVVAACSVLLLTSPLAPPSSAGDPTSPPVATAYPGAPGQGRVQQVPAVPGAYTAFQTGIVGNDMCSGSDTPAPTASRQVPVPAQCGPPPRPGP
ncbi:MAG TPA: hypothetical protein VH008_03335 [Pseudonocardia sp.]|nr:hypothetical protein [Pseudonocardia sp.]